MLWVPSGHHPTNIRKELDHPRMGFLCKLGGAEISKWMFITWELTEHEFLKGPVSETQYVSISKKHPNSSFTISFFFPFLLFPLPSGYMSIPSPLLLLLVCVTVLQSTQAGLELRAILLPQPPPSVMGLLS